MQERLKEIFPRGDSTIININEGFLPLWMSSTQEATGTALGYTKAVPIAYVKPQSGSVVLEKIQEIHTQADITFVIGPDNFFKFAKFYRAEEITERWTVMACPEKVKIRSTEEKRNDLHRAVQRERNRTKEQRTS